VEIVAQNATKEREPRDAIALAELGDAVKGDGNGERVHRAMICIDTMIHHAKQAARAINREPMVNAHFAKAEAFVEGAP
jgi:hypothetical protein